jgi:hypothetical protein
VKPTKPTYRLRTKAAALAFVFFETLATSVGARGVSLYIALSIGGVAGTFGCVALLLADTDLRASGDRWRQR